MRDLLGIAFVHLAAVSLEEKFWHGSRTIHRGGGSATPLGWSSKAAGKRVCLQATAHFFAGPRVGAHFVEQGDADDADVASVVIFLSGIRFAHRTEAKSRHRVRALPKSFHHKLAMGSLDCARDEEGNSLRFFVPLPFQSIRP